MDPRGSTVYSQYMASRESTHVISPISWAIGIEYGGNWRLLKMSLSSYEWQAFKIPLRYPQTLNI